MECSFTGCCSHQNYPLVLTAIPPPPRTEPFVHKTRTTSTMPWGLHMKPTRCLPKQTPSPSLRSPPRAPGVATAPATSRQLAARLMARSRCGIPELSSARSAGPLNTRVCLRRPCVPVQVQQQRRLRHPHQQGQPLRWRGEPQRSLLFSSGSPVAPQLHLEVQGHGGGSTATPLTARVSQRVAVGRSAAEVRPGPAHLAPPRPALRTRPQCACAGAVAVPHAGRKRGGEERGAWWAGLGVRGGGEKSEAARLRTPGTRLSSARTRSSHCCGLSPCLGSHGAPCSCLFPGCAQVTSSGKLLGSLLWLTTL